MSKIAIVGASGFTGVELVKLIINHPKINEMNLFSFNNSGRKIKDFSNDLSSCDLILENISDIVFDNYDLIFFACPNGTVMNYYEDLMKSKTKVIDLAADYRLDNKKDWDAHYYPIKHKNPSVLSKIIYGLPEINREKIINSKIIANPGCYPTAAILGLAPLLKLNNIHEDIIIDAKSGYSGAGRAMYETNFKDKINDNFLPYNLYAHRHHPEIEQELKKIAKGNNVNVIFSPHILPIFRGILETIYVDLKNAIGKEELEKIYKEYYKNEYFIEIQDEAHSEIKSVVNTNKCQISLHTNKTDKKLTIISTIDNLLKGASGQAIQNMNLMLGYDEKLSL